MYDIDVISRIAEGISLPQCHERECTRYDNGCFAIPLNLCIDSHEDVQFFTITK